MPRPIRIMHVLSSFNAGGAEINTLRLAEALADRGFSQTVAGLSSAPGAARSFAPNVTLIRPESARDKLFKSAFLARAIDRYQPDVIHGRSYGTWVSCVLAKQDSRRKVRLIQSFHGPTSFERHKFRRSLTVPLLRRATDSVVCVSSDLARRVVDQWKVAGEKVTVISNGINTKRFENMADRAAAKLALGIDENTLVVGVVGSLRKVKNPALLIAAFARMRVRGSDGVLLMVGDGPLSAILARQAFELGMGEKVKFYGFKPNVDEYLAAMDIFVQSSHREGSPTAVLEAMAAGVATVAVRSTGCVELHESHGLPLLVGNDAETLAQVLHELAGDPHRRAELGAQGRQIVSESFSFDRIVDSYEHLYRTLAAAESETGIAAIQQVGVGLE